MIKRILLTAMAGLFLFCTTAKTADLHLKNGTVLQNISLTREPNGWFKVKHAGGIGRYHISEFIDTDQARLQPPVSSQPIAQPEPAPPDEKQNRAEPPAAIPAPARELHLLSDALKTASTQLIAKLETREVKRLAVSKIYFNGSGVHPVAQYIQRKLLGEMLDHAPEGLDILEREDMRLLVKENQLQWMVDGGVENVADESEALLMGEFLFDKAFGQALLSIRIIDSKSGSIMAATASVVDIDPDLSNRLGIPQSALSKVALYELQPPFQAENRFVIRLKGVGDLSLSPVSAVSQKYQFAVRIFYGFTIASLVDLGLPVLERELLYQIADERALADKSLESVTLGTGVIQTMVDESSPDASPTFFVKAVRRDGGALLAQIEVALKSQAMTSTYSGTTGGGIAPLGADDSLAAATRAYNEAASVAQPEALRFQESFVLSDNMTLPGDKSRLLKDADLPLWQFNEYHGLSTKWIRLNETPSGNIDGRKMFDWYLDKLIPREQGNVDALKAGLVSISIGGCKLDERNQCHIGPLNVIYARVASEYTIHNNRKSCEGINGFWYGCFSAFAQALYESMHPVLRHKAEAPIDPYSGTFRWKENNWTLEAVFNYSIETTWHGKYPGSVTVVMDFSPMKDRLYRVREDARED